VQIAPLRTNLCVLHNPDALVGVSRGIWAVPVILLNHSVLNWG